MIVSKKTPKRSLLLKQTKTSSQAPLIESVLKEDVKKEEVEQKKEEVKPQQEQKKEDEKKPQKNPEPHPPIPNKAKEEKKEPKVIISRGIAFWDVDPPKVFLESSILVEENNKSYVDTGLGFKTLRSVTIDNEVCYVCKSNDTEGSAIVIFSPCKHWSHAKCHKGVCPSCKPSKRAINVGQSPAYTKIQENSHGKTGFEVDNIYKNQKKQGIVDRISEDYGKNKGLNFKGDSKAFLRDNTIDLDDYMNAGKDIHDIIRLTGVSTLYELESKGLDFYFICDKNFIKDVNIMIKFGINRDYIMSKYRKRNDEVWQRPEICINKKGENVRVAIHPIEYMFRRGFTKSDFISLGWSSVNVITDGISKDLRDEIFRK